MIPKIIHQIWIQGQENLPDKYKPWQKSIIDKNPNYNYILWDDNKIKQLLNSFDTKLLGMYDDFRYIVQKADLARYAILYIYGGVYIDMDTECLKNINPLLNTDFFVGGNPGYFWVMNSVIGSVKNHPILLNCIKLMKERENFPNIWSHLTINYVCGTMMFKTAISNYEKKGGKIVYYDNSKILLEEPNSNSQTNNEFLVHHTQLTEREYLRYFTIKNLLIIITILIIFKILLN